jgi:glycogen debranching enzyme
MTRPLAADSLSLTGAGAALVTSHDGMIRPGEVEGLVVDDVRVVSRWELDVVGATLRRVGWERLGPSTDRILFTVSTAAAFDPIAVLERRRTVTGAGLTEQLALTAYAARCRFDLVLAAGRDDQPVHHLGDPVPAAHVAALATFDDGGRLGAPSGDGPVVTVDAPGWRADGDCLVVTVDAAPGETWQATIAATAATARAASAIAEAGAVAVDTDPVELGQAIRTARDDLRALTMPIDGRDVLAAGSPFFLALFGRDSMIAGMQFLLDSVRPLLDVLAELARHQATLTDEPTRAQPGRILHELRLGRAGVFGVPPGRPYYGAVDTSALFVIALDEAMRWGAPRDEVAALLPAARAALQWCADYGDVDGDGFIESVPHPTGLTNLGWKDSADSIVNAAGDTIVGRVALAEAQAYWYRALRSMAGIEQHLGVSDGRADLAMAEGLAVRFVDSFVYDTADGPFVGLALDDDKKLLTVRTSNAGHVLWSGVLPDAVAVSVANQLAGDGLFSGWGVRTVDARAAGYNPFGYHRGSVWPHDTAFAIHGAARHGCLDVVRRLSDGLVALQAHHGGQLPELLSGIARAEVMLPVPYTAANRPQAWAAGAMLVVARALLGLEPDAPNGVLRLNPCLDPATTLTVRDLRLGEHRVSFTARGGDIVELSAPGLDVLTGPDAVLAHGTWGRPHC